MHDRGGAGGLTAYRTEDRPPRAPRDLPYPPPDADRIVQPLAVLTCTSTRWPLKVFVPRRRTPTHRNRCLRT
jgi:hypothetical protein